jgi:hypothetical protein
VPRWWAWLALAIFFCAANGADALLALGTLEIPRVQLLRFVSLFLTWQWLEAECQPQGQTYPLDMGMFLYAAGIIVMPYYMWRNQRWRGLLKLGALVGLWGISYVLAHGTALLLATLGAESTQ